MMGPEEARKLQRIVNKEDGAQYSSIIGVPLYSEDKIPDGNPYFYYDI